MRQRIPKLPNPELLKRLPKTEAESLFSQWEKECEKVQQENKQQFERDLKKIRLCAFLKGLTGSLPFPDHKAQVEAMKQHYHWCPHEIWNDNSYLKMEIDEQVQGKVSS